MTEAGLSRRGLRKDRVLGVDLRVGPFIFPPRGAPLQNPPTLSMIEMKGNSVPALRWPGAVPPATSRRRASHVSTPALTASAAPFYTVREGI